MDKKNSQVNSKNFKETITVDFLREISVAKAVGFILLISVLSFLFLIWMIYVQDRSETTAAWIEQLPALNSMLNMTSTVLILFGYRAVLQRNYVRHMKLMLSAFVTSSLFLISYLIYHNFVGHTPFPGQGLIRPIYFFILITHIVLSAFVVPLVLTSFYFAWAGKFATHRRISRWTLPVWLYVSVTGVMIFLMLNRY